MVGGFGYLSIFAKTLIPSLDQFAAYHWIGGALGVAVLIGEAGICLWLLIMGARGPVAEDRSVGLQRPDVRQGGAA